MSVTITEELYAEKSTDILVLEVGTIALSLIVRTWDINIVLYLNSISTKLLQVKKKWSKNLKLIVRAFMNKFN